MQHVSGYGTKVIIAALRTFPIGFKVDQFADDIMPVEFSESQVGDHEFLVDGELFSYDTSVGISVKIGVVSGSDDDQNLNILLNSSRASMQLLGIPDVTVMTIMYPNQASIVLSNGYLRSGMFGSNVGELGKMGGKTYEFVFGESTQVSLKGLLQSAFSAASAFL